MKKILLLGVATMGAYRETGQDLVNLIKHADGCDFEDLEKNIKWSCQLNGAKKRICRPADCQSLVQMRCACNKRFVLLLR